MVLVFWQGIISIHQKAFLEALAKQPVVDQVLLVVENDITPYRKNMGWEVPEIKDVNIKISPTKAEIKNIIKEYTDAVHIMGGIKVGNMLTMAFNECVSNKCKLGIMTEPYNSAGIKGALRTFKYQYFRIKHFRHINFVLAIGRQGVKQYTQLGFDPKLIFPWAYFISIKPEKKKVESLPGIKRIIYAGRLDETKGIYKFVAELLSLGHTNFTLDIYGTGPDEEKLKSIVTVNNVADKVNFFPFLKYDDLLGKYSQYDWVVLPSTQKDGWGVIISEGLLNGLKAICSNICGVSWVIKNDYNGVVFDWTIAGSCKNAINKMLNEDTFAAPKTISDWAHNTITGEAGADYFLKIVGTVYNRKEKPEIPWMKGDQTKFVQ